MKLQHWIALITTGCFVVLSSYCYARYTPMHKHHVKTVMIWRDANAAKLASVYNLTPENIDKPQLKELKYGR